MQRIFVVTCLAVACLIAVAPEAIGCGDKFLVVGRGLEFSQGYIAPRPATILVYSNVHNGDQTPVKDQDLKATLERAGHRYDVAPNADALIQALASGSFDIVLVDISDAPFVQERALLSPSHPETLPVIFNPSRDDLEAARKGYSQVLKAPAKTGHLLAVIDRVMKSREKTS